MLKTTLHARTPPTTKKKGWSSWISNYICVMKSHQQQEKHCRRSDQHPMTPQPDQRLIRSCIIEHCCQTPLHAAKPTTMAVAASNKDREQPKQRLQPTLFTISLTSTIKTTTQSYRQHNLQRNIYEFQTPNHKKE